MAKIIDFNSLVDTSIGAFVYPNNIVNIINKTHEEYAKYLILNTNILNKEELKLLRIWLKTNKDASFCDFLVYVLGYDKIITDTCKAIVTTSSMPYKKYYNYALYGYRIESHLPQIYDKKEKVFVPSMDELYVVERTKDQEIEDEIFSLKKSINPSELYKYLK